MRLIELSWLAVAVAIILPSAVFARSPQQSLASPGKDQQSDVDSEHIFGFTEGTDLGRKGEREAEFEPFLRFGKRSGGYFTSSTALLYKYSFTDNFRVAPAISFASHWIENVPGLANTNQFEFEGIGGEIRYGFLDRARAPFGLALSFDPRWGRVDSTTGERVDEFAAGLIALVDTEIVPKRLYGAFNFSYDPVWTKLQGSGETERSSTIAMAGALSTPVGTGLFVGAEARYFRKYEGTALDSFEGDALFIGPTLYAKLSEKWFASAAWNAQVYGHAVGVPGNLDLINFDRHEVRIRVGVALN